jgi:hypothetical protein
MLACHTRRVTIAVSLLIGFEAWENCGLVPWPGLPLCCHQSCLAYFVVAVSASLPPTEPGLEQPPVSYFSVSPCFSAVLSPCHLFLIFSVFPLCFQNIVCLLLPQLFSFIELHGVISQSTILAQNFYLEWRFCVPKGNRRKNINNFKIVSNHICFINEWMKDY